MKEELSSFAERTDNFALFLDKEHFRFHRQEGAVAGEGHVEVASGWELVVDAPSSPLVVQMSMDFRRFCAECFNLCLEGSGTSVRKKKGILRWHLVESDQDVGHYSRQDPAVETFELRVSEGLIEISAKNERGLLHGTHFVEWKMADAGGPFLMEGVSLHRPAFTPRVTNGVFAPPHPTLQSPGRFSDDYLSLMSHYGANAIYLSFNLWDIFRNEALPELNSDAFSSEISTIEAFNQRTLKFGIDLYFHLNTPPLPEDHPVFIAHPEVRGSLVEIFLEELSGKRWYSLCSSSPKVLAAYAEAVESLFSAASSAAGATMVVGGESFYHCFSRPAETLGGETNCVACSERVPSQEVANLVNVVKNALKRTGRHKELYAWPYSAFIWSKNDSYQEQWIKYLDADVSVLSNYDCGDSDAATRSGARFFDYNIKCTGASEIFEQQNRQLFAMGRPIFAKTESNTTPDAFFLPYLPLHHRWATRFASMRQDRVAGYIGQWRFFGMNATLPEELQYRFIWEEEIAIETLLKSICRRDFALNCAGAAEVVEGWRLLSDAWESFPYSAMTSGERAAYMRGPFYLGPAHPLIFDIQSDYGLPASFRTVRGDLAELATAEEIASFQATAKPRYVSDLLTTLPFGTGRYVELVSLCRAKWEQGMALLRKHLAGGPPRAIMELDICEALGSHLLSLENVVRFYQVREQMNSEILNVDQFKAKIAILQSILTCEIENATRMLPVLERDPRIGYGHAYGPVYDIEMVKAKIGQCQYVRDFELPRFSQVVRFHVWLEYP